VKCLNRSHAFVFFLASLAVVLLPVLYGPAWAREKPAEEVADPNSVASDPSDAPPAGEKRRAAPTQPGRLDKTGDILGRQVDDLAEKASGRLGGWVNIKLFSGITWLKLIVSLLMLFVVVVVERLARAFFDRRVKTATEGTQPKKARDYVIRALGKPLRLFIWVYGVYFALTPLFVHFRLPDGSNLVYDIARKAADLGAAVAIVWFVFRLVDMVDLSLRRWAASTDSTIDDMLAPLLGKTLRVFIIVIGAILIIQNLTGMKIGPLLASLGVGGIAVALAAKDSIANFFGTLTILFDKPFQVGQRVVIDSTDGTVEDVGFRSTRIRTLTGHLVTIPNEKLVNTPIENIGERPNIRWLTNITIAYDTPPEKIEKAVAILREILADHEGMHPDHVPRVYFNGFNDWSLNILMLAWYHPPDYWAMQAWQQRTCLEILRRFSAEGIAFAFPSQTVYVANDDVRQLKLQMLKGEVETESQPVSEGWS
jgi:MscS family membrane protein